MTTLVALLRARRRTVEASRKRHAPPKLAAVAPPNGIVTAYTSELLRLSRELDEAFAAELVDAGVPMRADAQGDVPDLPTPAALAARLRRIAERIVGRRSLVASITAIATKVNDRSREEWTKQVKGALGVDLSSDPDLTKKLVTFRNENVKLIESLAADKVERVKVVLTEAGSSARVETIAKALRAETGATASRAALIARDQVLSLNAQVTESRHKAAGITEYIWRTSRDERVRKAHKDLDNTRHKYSEPPVVDERTGRRENPGNDFQCRCTAEPILPGIDD